MCLSLKAYYWEVPLIRGNWRDGGPVGGYREARECFHLTLDQIEPLSVVTCACAMKFASLRHVLVPFKYVASPLSTFVPNGGQFSNFWNVAFKSVPRSCNSLSSRYSVSVCSSARGSVFYKLSST